MSRGVRLDRLLDQVEVFDRPIDARRVEITNITDDSRKVQPGALFCCVSGSRADGHQNARDAVERGAVALVVEHNLDVAVPQVRVTDVRSALAPIASAFYDHPDKRLRIVGITGTNGKTTATHILANILRAHRWKTAVIGTLTGAYTTPPAIELQRMLHEIVENQNHAVVMEVSSHALVQHRVDCIRFDVGVFLNLTQDHLDYHKTMSRYFEAKSVLFDPGRCETAVVNVGDRYGRQLLDRLALPTTEFSIEDAKNLRLNADSSDFVWRDMAVHLPLVGSFNVENALAAAFAAREMNIPVETIVQALNHAETIPGRVEMINEGQPFSVFVDFSHTPDGLSKMLHVALAAAEHSGGRVIVVFGCGGDRDHDKRAQMGAVAEQLADHVVVTSDNPRSEDPAEIINQILGGMAHPEKAHVIEDRAHAISTAIENVSDGDVVVIAGKGHETTQQIGNVKHPFDDRIVARQAIEYRRARTNKRGQEDRQ